MDGQRYPTTPWKITNDIDRNPRSLGDPGWISLSSGYFRFHVCFRKGDFIHISIEEHRTHESFQERNQQPSCLFWCFANLGICANSLNQLGLHQILGQICRIWWYQTTWKKCSSELHGVFISKAYTPYLFGDDITSSFEHPKSSPSIIFCWSFEHSHSSNSGDLRFPLPFRSWENTRPKIARFWMDLMTLPNGIL